MRYIGIGGMLVTPSVTAPPVVVSGSAWVQTSSMQVVTSQPLVATADDWVALLIEDELRRKEAAALDDLDAVLTGPTLSWTTRKPARTCCCRLRTKRIQ